MSNTYVIRERMTGTELGDGIVGKSYAKKIHHKHDRVEQKRLLNEALKYDLSDDNDYVDVEDADEYGMMDLISDMEDERERELQYQQEREQEEWALEDAYYAAEWDSYYDY